jgi:xylulokinase
LGADDWATDPASLTLNGMMDIRALDWSDRILKLCGIDRDRLPPVKQPSGIAGKLSKAAAAETGLPEGITLCRGAGDQQCAAIGAGVIKQGMAEFTVGTSS